MKIIHHRDPFLPVIGGAEIFLDYVGKYFVKKGHQEEKIQTLHSDYGFDLAVRIGKEARKFVEDNCSIEVVGSQTEKIYERLLSK